MASIPVDPTAVKNLQTSCSLLAHMVEQFRLDRQNLKSMDVDWLASRVDCWYEKCEKHLAKFQKRLLYYAVDPKYDCGSVSNSQDITALLKSALSLSTDALAQFGAFRKQAWDLGTAGYLPDLYEHAIDAMEHICYKAQRELNLIGDLGEANYIGARLEDA